MTLTSSTPKIVYTGNGTTGPFSFPFTVFESDSSDLVVEKYTIATGATTTMTITTDYTVSVSSYPGSGSITLVSSLSSAYKLIIRRSLEMSQETDLQPNDDLPANTIETMVDKAVAMVQQVKEVADRGLVQDVTQSTQINFPGASANKYIGWNDTGTALENKTLSVTETQYNGTISRGTDASKPASPAVGDIYLATDTKVVYACWSTGTWSPVTIRSGSTASKPASPAVGDFYYDTDKGVLYRCDTAGTWNAKGEFQTGLDASKPASPAVGDVYLATDTGILYRCDTAATWVTRDAHARIALTDAATIATNCNLGNVFDVTLGGNRTLGNPTNPKDGAKYVWRLRQDGTGNRTIALDTKFRLGADITAVTLSTAAGKTDYLGAIYHAADDKFDVVAFVKGY